MRCQSPVILNAGERSALNLEHPVDITLALAMADLKARFINMEGGLVHYRAIRGSEEFEKYRDLTKGLKMYLNF